MTVIPASRLSRSDLSHLGNNVASIVRRDRRARRRVAFNDDKAADRIARSSARTDTSHTSH